jgi:two-component system phosphate regulon sensor histidine kinase PhoR
VLKNLLSNAIKYSPQGGSIMVRGEALPGCVQVSVQDRGIGMSPDQQTHLFEKFYRANASNTAIGGTGLGLAICKLIVELHGGRIGADSEYGAGSTFFFTLPISSQT